MRRAAAVVLLVALFLAVGCSDPAAPAPERRADLVCNDCTPWVPDVPPACAVKANPRHGCSKSQRQK